MERRTFWTTLVALCVGCFVRPAAAPASTVKATLWPRFIGKFSPIKGHWYGFDQPKLLFTEYDLAGGPQCLAQSGEEYDKSFVDWTLKKFREWADDGDSKCVIHVRMLDGHPDEISIRHIS